MNIIIIILLAAFMLSCSEPAKKINVRFIKSVSFGKEQGNEDEIFGSVRFITLDKEGNIYGVDFAF